MFPLSGSPVVPLDKILKQPTIENYESLTELEALQSYVLPDDPLAFTMDSKSFSKFCFGAFEPRGLLMLKMSYRRRGSIDLWKNGTDIPDKEIECRHIELMFAQDPTFSGYWKIQDDPTSVIKFEEIESVVVKKEFIKRVTKFIIKLKPGISIRYLNVDAIVREVTLVIDRKDIPLARKLQSAIMYELSQASLQGLFGR